MIRVLIVDDSEVHRKLISYALNNQAGIEVVGTAENPYVARDLINLLKPDVITLDLQMPRMDGLTFLGKIMESHPYPVIIVSSYTPKNSTYALKALRMGALETISKPGLEYNLKEFSALLAQTVRGAAEANVRPIKPGKKHPSSKAEVTNAEEKIIAIGSSTGGTRALEFLLKQLPTGLPGIVIVQHLPESFTNSFASRLNNKSAITIKEAADYDEILPGHAYIAKGNNHLVIQKKAGKTIARLSNAEPVNYHRPSADVLFNSVASEFGPKATGVILTGMGSDGAEGLLNMRQSGAFTIGQDESTSVVYGMPKAAFEIGAVCDQLPLDDIPDRLINVLNQHATPVESNGRLHATNRF